MDINTKDVGQKQNSSQNDLINVDNELIIQAKNGDATAFGLIYDVLAQRLFRFLYLKISNKSEAEDALQDVFIKAWKALPNYKGNEKSFPAWMYRIAANTANDVLRKRYKVQQELELNEDIKAESKYEPESSFLVTETNVQIKEALATLEVNYRQVLELRFIEEFSVSEVAKILNKTNLSVRLLQHRALKKLRKNLSN